MVADLAFVLCFTFQRILNLPNNKRELVAISKDVLCEYLTRTITALEEVCIKYGVGDDLALLEKYVLHVLSRFMSVVIPDNFMNRDPTSAIHRMMSGLGLLLNFLRGGVEDPLSLGTGSRTALLSQLYSHAALFQKGIAKRNTLLLTEVGSFRIPWLLTRDLNRTYRRLVWPGTESPRRFNTLFWYRILFYLESNLLGVLMLRFGMFQDSSVFETSDYFWQRSHKAGPVFILTKSSSHHFGLFNLVEAVKRSVDSFFQLS